MKLPRAMHSTNTATIIANVYSEEPNESPAIRIVDRLQHHHREADQQRRLAVDREDARAQRRGASVGSSEAIPSRGARSATRTRRRATR
jgi:hypothetical protein